MIASPNTALSAERERPAPAPADPQEDETMDDEAMAFVIVCNAWEEYLKALAPDSITDCMKRFATNNGIPETCRLVKIFGIFEAGMSAGLDLAVKIASKEDPK